MKVTRRIFGAGVLGVVSAGLGTVLLADQRVPTAARFAADLTERLVDNPSRARFSVTSFAYADDAARGTARVVAEVRLDWSPGFRVRRFTASGRDAEAAYAGLMDAAAAEFAGVVPGFDGAPRTA